MELSDTSKIAIMPGVTRRRNGVGQWYNAPYLAITQSTNGTPRFKSVVELETVYTHGLTTNTPKHNIELSLYVKLH